MNVFHNYYEVICNYCCRCNDVRILMKFFVTEQAGPAVPTPQFYGPKQGEKFMDGKISDTQQIMLGPVVFKTAKDKPTTVDGKPEWLTDNSDILALTPSDDGMSCLVKAVGVPGVANVTLRADADRSEEVRLILGHSQIEVVQNEATTVEIPVGTPEEQPA